MAAAVGHGDVPKKRAIDQGDLRLVGILHRRRPIGPQSFDESTVNEHGGAADNVETARPLGPVFSVKVQSFTPGLLSLLLRAPRGRDARLPINVQPVIRGLLST